MAKELVTQVKLQVPAGSANPAPPVGPALGQHGLNIQDFCKQFNDRTKDTEKGLALPVVINVYQDRTFDFIVKSTPAAILLKKAEENRISLPEDVAFFVAKQIAEVAKNGNYDLILAGKESIDYNGGMVPGMIASILDYDVVTACIGLEIDGSSATIIREIDGGKETLSGSLPLVIGGQKGLVEEKDLRIPNMRGIMTARKKPLTVVESIAFQNTTTSTNFEKPVPKGACTMITSDNVDELVSLLHEEAKVI